jgi:hypothetical protein
MEPRQYDLFEITPSGRPQWIGAAVNLEHARKRVRELTQARPGMDCFAREFSSGAVVAIASRSRTSGKSRATAG